MKKYHTTGNGEIRTSYDGHTSWLEVDSQLIAMTTICDSISSYLINVASTGRVNEILADIEFDFYTTHNFWEEKADCFQDLLVHFDPGVYYVNGAGGYHFIGKEKSYDLIVFSPEILQCTKRRSELDAAVIQKYKQEIASGLRPIVLAYREDFGTEYGHSYVLDGHHKLVAYEEARIQPTIWELVKMNEEVSGDTYDETNPNIGPYLDYEEIISEALQFDYHIIRDRSGKITAVRLK